MNTTIASPAIRGGHAPSLLDPIEAMDLKILDEVKQLDRLYHRAETSEEPWDYREQIDAQHQYIAGLCDGRERLIHGS